MKKLLIILLAFSMSYALNPFSWYWSINLDGDTATVGKWKNNNDSVLVWSNKVCDTLNTVVPRWNYFSNHDSTFKWMNIDTIGGRVKVDTVDAEYLIAGEIDLDTLESLAIDTLYGPVELDTISSDLYLENNLTVKADCDITTGLIINSDGYPDYWHNIYMPYSRYDGAWLGYGMRIGPRKIGGTSGVGAFQVAFSDTSTSSTDDSIDTLDYTAAFTVQRNGQIYFEDSTYIGVTSNRQVVRFFSDSITVAASLNILDNLAAFDLSCNDVTCDSINTGGIESSSNITCTGISTGSEYFQYIDTTFNDSLYESSTLRATSTMRIIAIGDVVFAHQNADLTYGSLTGASEVSVRGIPTLLSPTGVVFVNAVVYDNSGPRSGYLVWGASKFVLYLYDGTTPSNSGGLSTCTMKWTR